jgi:hypothetical protein
LRRAEKSALNTPKHEGFTMNAYSNYRSFGSLDSLASRFMSNDMIRRVAPSVFADAAHESRSARYAYIQTLAVVEGMRREGFEVIGAQQARSRLGRHQHTKHMLTFARPDTALARVGDSVPAITLVNSHDGSSAYNLMGGLFRLVCRNGLICAQSQLAALKVQHTGRVIERVIEGSFEVIEGAKKAGDVAADWRATALSRDEQRALGNAALMLRWDGQEHKAPISVEQVLRPRRSEDTATDLWTTFNAVQENMVRGGQRGAYNATTGRRAGVRQIKGIDGNVALNRALWALGESMRALKG